MTDEPQSPDFTGRPVTPGESRQPQPFSEGPQEPPGGCGRPLLIGCAVTAVLLGLLLLGLLWKAGDLMPALFRWSLDTFERQVAGRLPADLGEAERQRLADAFDRVVAAVEDGTADPAALQRLQPKLLEVARSRELDREQVLELIEALEAVAGERAPPAPAEPLPESGEERVPVARRGAPTTLQPAAGSRLAAA